MNATPTVSADPVHYELRFESRISGGRAYIFPCDATGHVDMDVLSDTAREDYLYARIAVGGELSIPAVIVSGAH